MTLVLGAVLRAPLVRKTQNKCHSFLCASLVRSVQIKRVFTCQNLPEHGSGLAILREDRNEPPPNDAFWYAKVRLSYAFLLLSEKKRGGIRTLAEHYFMYNKEEFKRVTKF